MTHENLKSALQYAERRLREIPTPNLYLCRHNQRNVWKILNIQHSPDVQLHFIDDHSIALVSLVKPSVRDALDTQHFPKLEEKLVNMAELYSEQKPLTTLRQLLRSCDF